MSEQLREDYSELDSYRLAGRSLNEWHAWLTTYPGPGDPIHYERTPGSRYGRDANSAAWWAVAGHAAYSYATGQGWDETQTEDSMKYFMGLAVNDDPSVVGEVREFKDTLPSELTFILSWDMVELRATNDGGKNLPDVSPAHTHSETAVEVRLSMCSSVARRVIFADDVSGDPSARRHLDAVAASPLADGPDVNSAG